MSRRRAVTAALLATAALYASASCTQVGADPDAIVALAFDSLPYPAVIAGDSLRDESGTATALRAVALNSEGDEIPGAPFEFFALDAGATVSAEAFVLSTGTEAATIRVVAQTLGGLQSREIGLRVTPRPDSVVQDGTVDTVRYTTADPVTSNGVSLRLFSNVIAPPPPVNGWIVRYSVEYAGVPVPPTDATLAWLLDDNGRRSIEDTTGSDGRVSRRLRVMPAALANAADSVVVFATVTRYGTPLVGSPVRIAVHLRFQAQ